MIVILLFACGGSAPPPPPPPPPPPAVAPVAAPKVAAPANRVDMSGLWGELALPVEDGEVLSGGDMVILQWTGTARAHHDAFAKALTSHGFTLASTLPGDGQTVEMYARDGRDVMLSVSDDTITLQNFGADASP